MLHANCCSCTASKNDPLQLQEHVPQHTP
jgi:hypothetical protein